MFHTIATIVAALMLSRQTRAEQVHGPSSDESYMTEVHDILMETAMSALAGFIVFIAYQYLRPKKVKSLKANMDTVYKEPCATHLSVVAETQPANVYKKAQGKAVYTPETNLIASLACKGHVSELLQTLDAIYQKFERRNIASPNKALLESSTSLHVTAAVRACLSQRRFREAITVFDHCCNRVGSADAKLWSLLVYASSNSEEHVYRCGYFFEKLWEHGNVNSTDVVNVTTFFAATRNLLGFRAMLMNYVEKIGLLDNVSRNRAMAVCAKAGAHELLLELASDSWSETKDVVTYNTLMKYYVQTCNTAACLQTFCKMREANVKPTEISIGIILDGCIQQSSDHNQVDLQHLFDLLLKSDLPMNKVNYTTYIKGLVRVGRFDKAAEVLQHMRQTPELSPDVITYSTMVKGFADKGDIAGGLKLLQQMISDGVAANHVVFNYLLQGCSMQLHDPSLVDDLLSKMMSHGFKPSRGSLSIMLKIYAKSSSWSKAFDLLQSAASRFGIAPEQRIYVQLARACHNRGETHWVRQIYETMKEDFALCGERIDEATHQSMMSYCKQHRGVKVQ